jgi:hypothetical protein
MNAAVFPYLDILFSPDSNEALKYPPLFIVGAPRSGSTLMAQVLTNAFDLGYLTNGHCKMFGAPALAERIFHFLRKSQKSSYISFYGKTKGMSEPAECGNYWYRFFRKHPASVSISDVENKKMTAFRRSVAALLNAFDRPLLFKNLYASLRIEPIYKYIPEALFVVTERDEISNAHSILRGRYDYFGNYNDWFSVPPVTVEKLKTLPPEQQAIEQIRHIHLMIYQSFLNIHLHPSKLFVIKYEDFCEDVHGALNNFANFMKKNGVYIDRKFEVPKKFDRTNDITIESSLYQRLVQYSSDTYSTKMVLDERKKILLNGDYS